MEPKAITVKTTVVVRVILNKLTTSEVALLVDVSPNVLSKWKARGYLKLAPKGIPGQGRGNELLWSTEAVEEAIQWMNMHRPGRKIARNRRR